MRFGDLGLDHGEDAAELIDAIGALERDFELEEGTLMRELAAMLGRRRRFEQLRRAHDFRSAPQFGGARQWRG